MVDSGSDGEATIDHERERAAAQEFLEFSGPIVGRLLDSMKQDKGRLQALQVGAVVARAMPGWCLVFVLSANATLREPEGSVMMWGAWCLCATLHRPS